MPALAVAGTLLIVAAAVHLLLVGRMQLSNMLQQIALIILHSLVDVLVGVLLFSHIHMLGSVAVWQLVNYLVCRIWLTEADDCTRLLLRLLLLLLLLLC
jgi:hypothetical protein